MSSFMKLERASLTPIQVFQVRIEFDCWHETCWHCGHNSFVRGEFTRWSNYFVFYCTFPNKTLNNDVFSVVACPDPTNLVRNAVVSGFGFQIRSEATIRCNEGYQISPTVTHITIRCLKTGNWDTRIGKETCKRKLLKRYYC